MIIESEDQYQSALMRIQELYEAKEETPQWSELQDLVAEVKIWENNHKDDENTYEFWTPKPGKEQGSPNSDDYNIVHLRETELTQGHIDILVREFLKSFEKLPAQAKRRVRKKLQY